MRSGRAEMMKSLLHTAGLLCLLMLSGCENPEAALLDERAAPAAPADSVAPVKTLRAGPDQKPAPAPVSAAQTAQPQTLQAVLPAQHTPKVSVAAAGQALAAPVRRNGFPVRRCMNMGNALEAPAEGEWGYRIRARDLRAVAAAGFDTIRLPVRWDNHTAHRRPYEIDAAHMARVTQVVRQAQAAGLGVILDVHHYESLMNNTPRETGRFLAIWDQIARAFAGAPDTVYFEVLNEPTLDMSMAELNQLYEKVLPIIRKTNPSRKIIMGGNSWNSVETMPKVKWPADPNIVATFHDYGPHEFTHQGASWMNPVMPMGRVWGGSADKAEFDDTYAQAKAFHSRTGIPVLVGEFGVIDTVPMAQRSAWMKARRQAMEASGFSWCAWDFSGAFKTYDTQTNQWLPGALAALLGP